MNTKTVRFDKNVVRTEGRRKENFLKGSILSSLSRVWVESSTFSLMLKRKLLQTQCVVDKSLSSTLILIAIQLYLVKFAKLHV